MLKYLKSLILLSLTLFITATVSAQSPVQVGVSSSFVRPKDTENKVFWNIVVKVPDGWHINSNQPTEDFLIPTTLAIEWPKGIKASEPVFAKPHSVKFEFWEKKLSVYEGTFTVRYSLELADSLLDKPVGLKGAIHYQPCNDQSCVAPTQVEFSKALEFEKLPLGGQEPEPGEALKDFSGSAKSESGFSLGEENFVIAFITIFGMGLLLCATPCVFPMIPITLGFFISQGKQNKFKTVTLPMIYVLGMAITYSVLGVSAALSGQLFGSALQNPYVLVFVALVLVALSLSMFGLYDIQVPSSVASRIGAKQGFFGALFMGLTVGIVAAPCVGPFVLGLLVYVGEQGSVWTGFWMFFALSLGLGFPFMILGIFSSSIHKLPASGVWMEHVKKFFGFVLIGMAYYFLQPLIPKSVYFVVFGIYVIGVGVYYLTLKKENFDSNVMYWSGKALSIALIVLGLWLLIPSSREGIVWEQMDIEKIMGDKRDRQPIIIDFTADWCAACKELEHKTFTDRRVKEESLRFLRLRADMTKQSSPNVAKWKKEFNIIGLPTVVFIDSMGGEVPGTRITGFVGPDKFLDTMKKVK